MARNTLETLKQFAAQGSAGNRWFKVNLHVHAKGNNPAEIVSQARQAEIDLIAITDHQTLDGYDRVGQAAKTAGRPLAVLPGIEITTHEGVHVLAIFPAGFSMKARSHLIGWLDVPGTGDTRVASRKNLADILEKVEEVGGVIVVPHPFSPDIGMLDSARKISTKARWLETGRIHLMQVAEEKVKYLERDDEGNWLNRYVLSSARPQDIETSSYFLAPFNRSDAHKVEEIADGCSWFRMAEPTVDGLQQVACEPRTRISRDKPRPSQHDCILGMHITGGYCEEQQFAFNEGLSCIVGQNYAGKSAVFDFIRFALAHENSLPNDSRERLLLRLHGILKPGGAVELYVRHREEFCAVRRAFNPVTSGEGPGLAVSSCPDPPVAYCLDQQQEQLVPVDGFTFPIEVYEQGRINRLRDDVPRQLDMLDEFASLAELKASRDQVISKLNQSAETLAPLYEERDNLKAEVGRLPDLKKELRQKEKHLPGEAQQKWANAATVVEAIETAIDEVAGTLSGIPSRKQELPERTTDLQRLFGQQLPAVESENVAESATLLKWRNALKAALDDIENARVNIVATIQTLATQSNTTRTQWEKVLDAHNKSVRQQLAKVGVESPDEIIQRVAMLRSQINTIEKTKKPQLAKVGNQINREENARENLLTNLRDLDQQITERREQKARELTDQLDGQIQISVEPAADHSSYVRALTDLCDRIGSQERRIRNREDQINRIVSNVPPLRLAEALANKGQLVGPDGSTTSIEQLCGVTLHTQNVLCSIADSIHMLNDLQIVSVPDVPQILVRRKGESSYADLRTGLSPGEQSAAILTLALETRAMPLVVDQPEDELGYSYVVHLIVPKILRAKFSRQILVITHDANIPVLGDADHVTKMENKPVGEDDRRCVVAAAGCFESAAITQALVELEGGTQAFQFRQYRYTLAGSS